MSFSATFCHYSDCNAVKLSVILTYNDTTDSVFCLIGQQLLKYYRLGPEFAHVLHRSLFYILCFHIQVFVLTVPDILNRLFAYIAYLYLLLRHWIISLLLMVAEQTITGLKPAALETIDLNRLSCQVAPNNRFAYFQTNFKARRL